jgi:hypothetical protein
VAAQAGCAGLPQGHGPPACEAKPPFPFSSGLSIPSIALRKFRGSAFAQSRTLFYANTWTSGTVLVQQLNSQAEVARSSASELLSGRCSKCEGAGFLSLAPRVVFCDCEMGRQCRRAYKQQQKEPVSESPRSAVASSASQRVRGSCPRGPSLGVGHLRVVRSHSPKKRVTVSTVDAANWFVLSESHCKPVSRFRFPVSGFQFPVDTFTHEPELAKAIGMSRRGHSAYSRRSFRIIAHTEAAPSA